MSEEKAAPKKQKTEREDLGRVGGGAQGRHREAP